jgi:hypothetical protein
LGKTFHTPLFLGLAFYECCLSVCHIRAFSFPLLGKPK